MSQVSILPAGCSHYLSKPVEEGYALLVISSENDGDNRIERQIFGLAYEDALMYFDIAQLFKNSYKHQLGEILDFANIYQPTEDIYSLLAENIAFILCRHPDSEIAKKLLYQWEEENDPTGSFEPFLQEIYGRTEYYTRLIETVEVIYLPDTLLFGNATQAITTHLQLLVDASLKNT